MTDTPQWHRARSDVRKRTTRNKGRTTTRVTGRGELSTLIGAREAHEDAGRVPMAVMDHALDHVRETAHGADGDALARLADRWALAIGAGLPALIGNERNSWSEAGTMPTDPAILASIAATTCGLSGGVHLGVDRALAVHVTHKHSGRTFPDRYKTGTLELRKGESRRTIKTGRRTIRPDIITPNYRQGFKGEPHVWHDPVTEQDRPRLRWTIHELPALHVDSETLIMGHGRPVDREPSERMKQEAGAKVTRDSVSVDAPPEVALARTFEHAMKHADPVGRWEWRAANDIRGILSIGAPDKNGKHRLNVNGSGYRVNGARTIAGAIKQIHEQTNA